MNELQTGDSKTNQIYFFNPETFVFHNQQTVSGHYQCCDSICVLSSFEIFFVGPNGIYHYNTLTKEVRFQIKETVISIH
jgi:hypothetical protein